MIDRRLLPIVVVAAVFTIGAAPARADFNAVVRAVESRYHVRHTSIPFFGLVRFALWVAHPEGVSDVQLATFEGAHFDDAAALAEIVRTNAGEALQPVVQTHSSHGHETTQIYARPLGGDRVAMLVIAHDHEDTTLVRVVVSADQFEKAVHETSER